MASPLSRTIKIEFSEESLEALRKATASLQAIADEFAKADPGRVGREVTRAMREVTRATSRKRASDV